MWNTGTCKAMRKKRHKSQKDETEIRDVRYRGETIRSNEEIAVMAIEWRGCINQLESKDNCVKQEERMKNSKSYEIPKTVVMTAYKKVKANRGSAVIDG
jgi:hypothetical protein